AAVKSDMAIIGDETPAAPNPPVVAERARTFTYDKTAGGGVVGARDEDDQPRQDDGAAPGVKRFYTPVVLRMAEEHAIDLNTIQGSGAHGRVTRRDVERAIAERRPGAIGDASEPYPPQTSDASESYARARPQSFASSAAQAPT